MNFAPTNWAVYSEDGQTLAVCRPLDATRALKKAKSIVGTKGDAGQRAMENMLKEQPYTFVGFAASDQTIRDAHGRVLEAMRPGDSYVAIPLDALPPLGTTMSFGPQAS